jgi:acyl-coenzyme A thioesterase PaaI-like protein
MDNALPTYKGSFFCDLDREDGLKLEMYHKDNTVYCNFNINNRFEGYKDVLHGGMIFGILDVIIWYVIFMETKKVCMTRHVEMEFKKPVMCNLPYVAKGRIVKVKDRNFHASAWIEDGNGDIYSKVSAVFKESKDLPVSDLLGRMDFSRTSPDIKAYFMSLVETQS